MTLTQFNRIVEIRTKIISMGTFLAGTLFAVVQEGIWSPTRFIVTALAVLFVDMGTTGFNSYYDFIRGTDTAEHNLERDKVLVHEGVSPALALGISLTLFAAAAILGIILAALTSWYLILVGGVCMLVGYAYTGGPYPISRTPFGELFAGGFLGSILFMISFYAQALVISLDVLIASLPLLLLIALILTVNNTCDRKADKAAGRLTLSILLTEGKITAVMTGMLTLAYGGGALFAVTGLYPVTALYVLIPAAVGAFMLLRAMRRRGFSLETKGASMGGVSQIFLLYILAFSLGMIADLLI